MAAQWWVGAIFLLAASIFTSIIWHELRAWNKRARTLATSLGGQLASGSVIHLDQGGRACEVALGRVKHGPTQIQLAVPAQVKQTLSVHKRDLIDATATASGLIAPYATGDPAFDEGLLIQCADPTMAAALLAASPTRAGLKQLFDDGVHSVIWSAQDQAVIMRAHSSPDEKRNVALIHRALALAIDSTPDPLPGTPKVWSGGRNFKVNTEGRGTIIAVMLAVALPALAALPTIGIDMAYPPVERGPVMRGAAAFALLATVAWGVVSWRLRGRGLLNHRAWLPMLPLVALGSWVIAYGAAVGVNGAADNAEPITVKGHIEEKVQQTRSGSVDHGLITNAGFFGVNPSIHREARVGDTLWVTTRPGRLGIPWRNQVGDMHLAAKQDETPPEPAPRRKKRRNKDQ